MNSVQDFTQVEQRCITALAPLSNDSLSNLEEESPSSSASPAFGESSQESESRKPLKELSENSKENPDQEQQEGSEEENNQNSDKIADYVSKVLEKLVSQRNKMAKFASALGEKGLMAEKKVSQIQNMSHNAEEENASKDILKDDNDDDLSNNSQSKENLSPLKSKYAAKADIVSGPKHESPVAQKATAKYSLEDVLQISRRSISFGQCFPGQIVEENFDIVNKSNHDFVVQIILTCLDDDLQNTEEYVFSVRRSHLYDYNDKHFLIMAPFSCAGFRFALKVPNIRLKGQILGKVDISIQGISGSYTVDLKANVTVPQVFCPKELQCKGLDYKVTKLAIKEGKKQEFKVPIRNNGEVPVTLELEFYDPQGNKEEAERPAYDCLVHPNAVTIAPNSNTLISLIVKPYKTRKAAEKPKPVRKILVGKVRDTALIYSFVFWIETY